MNYQKLRFYISSLLIISFLIITFTGIGLSLAPPKKIDSNFTFLGLDKYHLGHMHTYIGFAFVILVMIHFYINYKIYVGEVKCNFK